MRELTLIGIFTGPTGAHVLVRLEAGEILRVDAETAQGKLSLIDTGDGWALMRKDETIHRLTLA